MAIGNSFGACVLSSFGGFWISVGIIFTPGGFQIMEKLLEEGGGKTDMFYDSFGLYLMVSPSKALVLFFLPRLTQQFTSAGSSSASS